MQGSAYYNMRFSFQRKISFFPLRLLNNLGRLARTNYRYPPVWFITRLQDIVYPRSLSSHWCYMMYFLFVSDDKYDKIITLSSLTAKSSSLLRKINKNYMNCTCFLKYFEHGFNQTYSLEGKRQGDRKEFSVQEKYWVYFVFLKCTGRIEC